MQAVFGAKREQQNHLFFKEYTNDKGAFHFHSQIELYFVDDGEMEVIVNDRCRVLQKGQMSVALSYDAHAYRTIDHSASSVLIIPPYLCEEFMAAVQNKCAANPFILDTAVVKRIKECFLHIQKGNLNKIALTGYIYVILGVLMEHMDLQEAEKRLDSALSSQLLFYINAHYKEELDLAKLSQVFGYSPAYLSRYFKACFHIGIKQYVNIIRLKNAIMLMNEKKHSVTYCALESGFESMRTFYRAFSKEFGCSPREYFSESLTENL